MSREMKIGIAQIDCIPCDIESNVSKVSRFARQAAKLGCRLVLFPEMVDTGYDTSLVRSCASLWHTGPYREISSIAAELGIHIVIGLSELEGAQLFNSVAAFGPNGDLIGSYRKTHLVSAEPICEDRIFTPGDLLAMLRIEGMNIGIMVCYDLRFPEVARTLALRGAEAICVLSAWPIGRRDHWRTLTAGRAIENELYLICANRSGTDGSIQFCGESCLIDPWGYTIASTGLDEDLITGIIAQDRIEEVRSFMPLLKERRENLYWEPGA